jgi:hypothetical protein
MYATRGEEEKLSTNSRLYRFLCITQLILALASMSCHTAGVGAGRNIAAAVTSASPVSSVSAAQIKPQPTALASAGSPIRKIDFRNFTYPWCQSDYTRRHGKRTITLRDGEMKVKAANNTDRLWASLPNVSYASLTRDKQEQAIITVTTNFDPNGSVDCIFVYTLQENKLKLLWSHATGDRANGGLRSLRVEGSELVVEQYDVKFDWAKGMYEEGTALCCPKRFIRSHYRWNGKRFEKSKSETIPNEYDNARFLGFPSDQPDR